ncbi:hypothetical protein M404DRAFT_998782 [Pisolithus tinctorius Marx 270]|uniref:Uncharacterized protein n=1 Tax=Pisolithus tinctorius Marx 270 TaxID=870435 RepID=A0A0C3KAK3_PISTI|nr:hypothetical protein M404DRAFT_998782 [Pisolithus tinctorius Marx 270]
MSNFGTNYYHRGGSTDLLQRMRYMRWAVSSDFGRNDQMSSNAPPIYQQGYWHFISISLKLRKVWKVFQCRTSAIDFRSYRDTHYDMDLHPPL